MLRKENRKNDTHVRKSKDHKHIGLLMKENFNYQLSRIHLESIEITCAPSGLAVHHPAYETLKDIEQKGAL